ncbi:hypothetical protein SAMN05444392_101125 [Seinonella peptonophila]|uniref:Uncharacterized protein n=1 Tax=Seinonella peptonophila TaxID=112248 RepID=A0A1M4SSX3_9BACL|nr:hypothetical protein [Seinonella peptonophila]SHE35354.1 hypothetical protein SAMN05444392_101125 [Seinonella peptonophila]
MITRMIHEAILDMNRVHLEPETIFLTVSQCNELMKEMNSSIYESIINGLPLSIFGIPIMPSSTEGKQIYIKAERKDKSTVLRGYEWDNNNTIKLIEEQIYP